jgi:type IV secretory pathway VirB10-like protein
MSQFERDTIGKEFEGFIVGQGKQILKQALEEYHVSLDQYRARIANVRKVRMQEMSRWDPRQLAPEMQVFSMRVENALYAPDPGQELRAIYSEAKESGDVYKLRACADALGKVGRASAGMPVETMLEVNRVAKRAAADVAEARSTPELQSAHKAAEEAFNQAMDARNELTKTDRIVSMQSEDFNYRPSGVHVLRALSRIIESQDGQAVILPRNNRTDEELGS